MKSKAIPERHLITSHTYGTQGVYRQYPSTLSEHSDRPFACSSISAPGRPYSQVLAIRRRPNPAPVWSTTRLVPGSSTPSPSMGFGEVIGMHAEIPRVVPNAVVASAPFSRSDSGSGGGQNAAELHVSAVPVMTSVAVTKDKVTVASAGGTPAGETPSSSRESNFVHMESTEGVGWGEESLSVSAAASSLVSMALNERARESAHESKVEHGRQGGRGGGVHGATSGCTTTGGSLSVEGASAMGGAAAVGDGLEEGGTDDLDLVRDAAAMSVVSEEELGGVAWVDSGDRLVAMLQTCELHALCLGYGCGIITVRCDVRRAC